MSTGYANDPVSDILLCGDHEDPYRESELVRDFALNADVRRRAFELEIPSEDIIRHCDKMTAMMLGVQWTPGYRIIESKNCYVYLREST